MITTFHGVDYIDGNPQSAGRRSGLLGGSSALITVDGFLTIQSGGVHFDPGCPFLVTGLAGTGGADGFASVVGSAEIAHGKSFEGFQGKTHT